MVARTDRPKSAAEFLYSAEKKAILSVVYRCLTRGRPLWIRAHLVWEAPSGPNQRRFPPDSVAQASVCHVAPRAGGLGDRHVRGVEVQPSVGAPNATCTAA